MKKLHLLACTLLFARLALAQVEPAYLEIDKQKRQGYAASTDLDRKILEKAWKAKLGEFGRVDSKRDVYTVNFAKFPFLDNQAQIISQLNTNKGRTQIFMSVLDTGSGEYIAAGHGQGRQVEAVLTDFMKQVDYEDQVRQAEKAYSDAESASKDAARKAERLLRDMESNKKEAERLAKKLEENKAEFLKLQSDTALNRKDRAAAAQVFEKQRQSLEAVRGRRPN